MTGEGWERLILRQVNKKLRNKYYEAFLVYPQRDYYRQLKLPTMIKIKLSLRSQIADLYLPE